MTQMSFWQKKISALLHDPLTKAFDIKGHEKLVGEICKLVGIEEVKGGSEEDKIASAFDRFPIPFELRGNQIQVQLNELEGFVHPLSGDNLDVGYSQIDPDKQRKYVELLKEKIKKLREENREDDKFYHALWWELPNLIDISQFLPADTRVPNHSIIDHLDSTAAVRSCVEAKEVNASLMMISIGPVQEIISQARKTIDLWAGSYLLSYLIYQAIEYIGLNYGFDTIIYPYLRGNSFVHKTLQKEGVKLLNQSKLPETDPKVASLPNVVLAILPSSKVSEIIKECETRIKEAWKKLASETLERFRSGESYNEEEFKNQIELFPIINKTYVNLIDDEDFLRRAMTQILKSSLHQKYMELLTEVRKHGGYSLNVGSFYSYIYRFLVSKMNAIKLIRYFPPYVSDSTLDGKREADDLGDPVRACFKVIDRQLDEEHVDLLGTLNTTKRFLRDLLGIKKLEYESTEDIANKNENPERNRYIAILMMDGDSMGKWISGQMAPAVEKVLHDKVVQGLKQIGISEEILKMPFVTPSYHRAVSRTLGVFSSFVEYVVEKKYSGMLIYTGGDDVLAMLPASKVLECANELRKMYSGIGVEEEINSVKYKFIDQILYVNDLPYTIMMGKKATISAGVAIIHQKSPLRFGIRLAREAERYAKEEIGRNAFAIFVMKRSGQEERIGAHWDVDGVDVVSEALNIHQKAEKLKLSHRSLYKFREEDLQALSNEFFEDLIDYILSRSDAENKQSEEFKELVDGMKKFFRVLTKGNINELSYPIDLLRIVRFMKRGEER